MIFSLLNLRKKIAAAIAGITIGAACLWGVAMWQDISPRELFNMFLAVLLMIVVIMLLAVAAIAIIKMLGKMAGGLAGSETDIEQQDKE